MKYSLKSNINMVYFLQAVDHCDGDVYFEDTEGDHLNLKSQLCKYLFLTLKLGEEPLSHGQISCCPEDAGHLSEFIVPS